MIDKDKLEAIHNVLDIAEMNDEIKVLLIKTLANESETLFTKADNKSLGY